MPASPTPLPVRDAVARLSRWRNYAVYADRAILVVNKPAGLLSQPTVGSSASREVKKDTKTVRPILQEFTSASGLVPWPAHRLDKDTTGALLCGRNPTSLTVLNTHFAQGTIARTYLAVVRGGAKTFPEREMVVRTRIAYDDGRAHVPKDAKNKEGNEEGKENQGGKLCETHLRVLASSSTAPVSLVELQAKTGRKHQLRVHLAHIGAPILGDVRYASVPRRQLTTADGAALPSAKFLHASGLSFTRFRHSGELAGKPFLFGIVVPPPRAFIEACAQLGLPLSDAHVRGGVYVDGERRECGTVPEVDGEWLELR